MTSRKDPDPFPAPAARRGRQALTRRRVLQAPLLALLGTPAWELLRAAAAPLPAEEPAGPADAQSLAATGTLPRDAMHTVLAFAEVLVGESPLTREERENLVEHIDDRTRHVAGYLTLYRLTAGLLDRLAGTPYAALGLAARKDLVVRHRLTPAPAQAAASPPAAEGQEHLVRTLAAPDILGGHYASAAGWAIVGYTVFPGRCGDLTRYTRPEP